MSRVKIYNGIELLWLGVYLKTKKIERNSDRNFEHIYRLPDKYDYCAFGTGWYLCYRIINRNVHIELLEANKQVKPQTKAIEMIAFFKEMLKAYKGYTFSAALNERSLKIYKSFIRRGFISEIYRDIDDDIDFMDAIFKSSVEETKMMI